MGQSGAERLALQVQAVGQAPSSVACTGVIMAALNQFGTGEFGWREAAASPSAGAA